MSIIDELHLSPEDVEKIVLAYCKAAVKKCLNGRKVKVKLNPNATLAAKILTFIAAQPGKKCKRYEISHQFKHTTQIRRLAAIEELLQAGELKTRTIRVGNNVPTIVYYIPD